MQTRLDGAFDQVSWDPRIAYVGAATSLDVNHQPHHQYQASTDFALTGRLSTTVNMPFAGTVRVAGALHKLATTTDDLAVQIPHNGAVVLNQAASRSTVGNVNVSHDLTVAKDDTVELRVRVDSPIAVQQVTWAPQLYYLTGPQAPTVIGQSGDGEITATAIPDIAAAAGTNADVMMTVKRSGVSRFSTSSQNALGGRAVDTYYPIDEPLGQARVFNTGVDSVAPTHTDYDVLDRKTLVRLPDKLRVRVRG